MMKEMRNKEGAHSLIGFIALCQSRSSLVLQTKRGIFRHPASVLAPESALGSLPSVALLCRVRDYAECRLPGSRRPTFLASMTRHNQRALRNASRLSSGRYRRGGRVLLESTFARARSFIAMSA